MADHPVHDLTPEGVAKGMAEGRYLLVDVREPNEVAVDAYPGAVVVPLSTFDPKAIAADTENLNKAIAVFNTLHPVDLTNFTMPAGTVLEHKTVDAIVKPGETKTLFETKKGGRTAAIKLGPAEAFAGRDRDVLLKVTWDEDKKPAILCPVGDFFGYGWGKPATGARFVQHDGDPVADLVLVQRVALERARARGLDPDNPRHLSRSVVLGAR